MQRLTELVLYPILAIGALVVFLYPVFLVPENLVLYFSQFDDGVGRDIPERFLENVG